MDENNNEQEFKEKLVEERRAHKRFAFKGESIDITLIIDDYKRQHGLAIVNDISLGGMSIFVKDSLQEGSEIKFLIEKIKSYFHAKVVSIRPYPSESYPFRVGLNFIFPFKDEAKVQQKEIIRLVYKYLKKMSKEDLVDRLMELFIERRRVFSAAVNKIDQTKKNLAKISEIIDFSMSGIIYADDDYNIIYANEAAEALLGLDPDDIKEATLNNIFSESTMKLIPEYLSKAKTEVRKGTLVKNDGSEIKAKYRVFKSNVEENMERIVITFVSQV